MSETATVQLPQGALPAILPVVRGLIGATLGFAAGAGLVSILRTSTGYDAWDLELNFVIGYMGAIIGWLMGVGMWTHWGREWLGWKPREPMLHGWQRYFTFCTDHKVIGVQYLVTFVVLFLLAGLFAMLIRVQLLEPEDPVLSENMYNRVMSLHGIIMIAVAVASVVGGFGNYFLPLMIGARDVAFPRLNALTFWLIPPVAVLLLAAQGAGGWDSGWTAYPPLSVRNASGQIFFNMAIITFGLSSILGALNFLTTVTHLRAPGMTWGKLPIFVWSIICASIIALTFTQFFAAAMLMVTLDRIAGFGFFEATEGGKPLLYQHIFWFYSHPAVYIFALPGFGITFEIIAHFARKPLFAYRWAVGGLLGIVAVSGLVWAHHMFVSGMSPWMHGVFLVSTEIISVPTGLVFLSALGTLWMAKIWIRTPMLFALSVVFNFMIGGITGIFLADVPTDINLSDTYFVVAHFHYTIVGAEIFALFAAIYYWFPKITGKMYNERLGQLHFWIMFIAFNMTFIPMFYPGLHGMNRRIATYTPELQGINIFISSMAFVLGSSFIIFVANMCYSLVKGPVAAADPWHARTLEWRVSSPPPVENFPALPVIHGRPYDYGVPNAPAYAIISIAGASGEDETGQGAS